jgi:hypothetical protein
VGDDAVAVFLAGQSYRDFSQTMDEEGARAAASRVAYCLS